MRAFPGLCVAIAIMLSVPLKAQLPSLKSLPTPKPSNLDHYVRDASALIAVSVRKRRPRVPRS